MFRRFMNVLCILRVKAEHGARRIIGSDTTGYSDAPAAKEYCQPEVLSARP